jgi:hypothetical protein
MGCGALAASGKGREIGFVLRRASHISTFTQSQNLIGVLPEEHADLLIHLNS